MEETMSQSDPTQEATSTESSATDEVPSEPTSGSNSSSSSVTKFVIYSSDWLDSPVPDISDIEGFNVVALSFLLSTGMPGGHLEYWAAMDKAERQGIKQQYNDAGIKVIVSAFGETEVPTTMGYDPTQLAQDMAQWVIEYDFDGIDVNYEDTGAIEARDGQGEEWVSIFTKELRSKLPQGQFLITHAPLAPWFSQENYPIGYQKVHEAVGDMIDWYNIQFYNQNDYLDCETIVSASSTKYPGSALAEIARAGIPPEKLVLGKPEAQDHANNGYMPPDNLAECVKAAKEMGVVGGVMTWKYAPGAADWIRTVRSQSWPEGS